MFYDYSSLIKTNPSIKNENLTNKLPTPSKETHTNTDTLEALKQKYAKEFLSEGENIKNDEHIEQTKKMSFTSNDKNFYYYKINENKPKKLYALLENFENKFLIKKIAKNNKTKKYLRLSLFKSEKNLNNEILETLRRANVSVQKIYPHTYTPYHNHVLKLF